MTKNETQETPSVTSPSHHYKSQKSKNHPYVTPSSHHYKSQKSKSGSSVQVSYFHFARIFHSLRKKFYMSKNRFKLTSKNIEKMKTFMRIIQNMGKYKHNMMAKIVKIKAKY